MNARTVLLWGDVGAGKTSLLATALLGPGAHARLPMIDWPASLPAIQDALLPAWERLTNGLLTVPTTALPQPVVVRLTDGTEVSFQDIMGERARRPDGTVRELLGRTSAVLFVMGWGATGRRRQFEAIRTALPALGSRPRALAFTRCEQALRNGHPAWAPGGETSGWWADHPGWEPEEADTLRQIGTVWPTSAYGFDGNGNPACVLDEFGELVPYNIRPANGTALLGWLLGRVSV
ncbi:MAG TPA: hypothetical protein VGE74_32155 [Gemmata sp.]